MGRYYKSCYLKFVLVLLNSHSRFSDLFSVLYYNIFELITYTEFKIAEFFMIK
jgi:hypothetical protein